jgi:hypothetical protein
MRVLNLVLAAILGVSLPVGETVRRWGTEFFLPLFLDDYLMGAMLLIGAWITYRNPGRTSFLIVAWAFSCGMLYSSFFGNLDRFLNEAQGSELSSPFWVGLIFLAFMTTVLGLMLTVYDRTAPKEGK